MSNITLTPPDSLLCWLKLYRLYRASFPRSERKPFPTILKKYRQHSTDIWCICRDGTFLGFAATMNSPSLVMLDYLVIKNPAGARASALLPSARSCSGMQTGNSFWRSKVPMKTARTGCCGSPGSGST